MFTEKQTIIVTTPEELMPLITEAVRAQGVDIQAIFLMAHTKNFLRLKMWKESLESTKKLSHTGGKKVLARHIRVSADAFSMNARCWKNTSPPDASKPWTHSDDGFIRQAYPR